MSVADAGTRAGDEGSPAAADEEEIQRRKPLWRELPVLIVLAFAGALLIKTFLLQAFYIPSASMEPTLRGGDRVLVEKVSGYFGSPTRGQVIVFEQPVATGFEDEDPSTWEDVLNAVRSLFGFPTEGKQDYIKRVMAIEGDTIEGRDGLVYVNGDPVEEPYLEQGTQTAPFPEYRVGANEIFVMGDNRDNSDDSRTFGGISEGDVVGHAVLLIWPPGDIGTI